MGLDQDFYKLKKGNYKFENREIIDYYEINDKVEHIIWLRKEYELSSIIDGVTDMLPNVDYMVISKEDLIEIFEEVQQKWIKLCKNDKNKEDRMSLYYISKILEGILNTFDFDNYYLLYLECG